MKRQTRSRRSVATTAAAARLQSAALHLDRLLRRQDHLVGLSGARTSALSIIVFHGPLTLGQLATHEQVSAPTMSRMIAALESLSLVRRVNGKQDQRSVWITATAKGEKLLRKARRRRIAELLRRLRGFSRGEIAVLTKASTLMERIIAGN